MNLSKKNIAIFTPYFGHINSFFFLWLRSACFNETIDFFIPTDCGDEIRKTGFVKSNIHIIDMSLADFKRKADSSIGIECNFDHVRKVCDYRCAIGLIFKNELVNYDFWGYTDNDQIMGNIRKFLTDEILSKYDKIGRWGHFSLFKNVDYMNKLFMFDARDKGYMFYEDVYRTPYNCFFEEATMVKFCELQNISVFEDENILMDVSPSEYKFIDRKWEDNKTPYYVLQNETGLFVISCPKKKMEQVKKEMMYVHFQKRKFDINIKKLKNESSVVFYPNSVVDEEQTNMDTIINKSKVNKPLYGLKKQLLHKYAVRYNEYNKKHSKTFKQKYY